VSRTDEKIIDALDGFDPSEYEDEARDRWGGAKQFSQSQMRTADYSPEQWAQIQAEAGQLTDTMAALFAAGTRADSEAAMDGAERHREHITRWYYDCSPDVHEGLGLMYVADPRYRKAFEGGRADRVGFVEYLRDAFAANAARQLGLI
jgi:hypothetical protein